MQTMRRVQRYWARRMAACTIAFFCIPVDLARADDAGSTSATTARASESTAPELTDQGLALYKAREFRRAAEKFLQAYAIDPDPNLLFNVARCYQALGDLGGAIEKYEAYLRSPIIDQAGRERAEKWLKTLREAADSKSTANARNTEKTPASDAAPRPAREAASHFGAEREPARPGTERSSVESKASRDAPGNRDGVALTVGWTATAALAAATAAVGIFAIDSANQLRAERAVFPGNAARMEDLATRTTQLGTAADVLGLATAVAAGLSLYFTVTRPSPRSELKAGLGTSGVRLTGSF